MASQNLTGYRAFLNGLTALSAFTRVAVSADGTLYAAPATGALCVGTLQYDAAPSLEASVRLISAPGTPKMIADTAITAWGYVFASNNGKVTAPYTAGLTTIGIAAAPGPGNAVGVAAVAAGAIIEVLELEGLTLE